MLKRLIWWFLLLCVQFSAKICLLTSFRDTCFIEIMPRQQSPQRGSSSKRPLNLLISVFKQTDLLLQLQFFSMSIVRCTN